MPKRRRGAVKRLVTRPVNGHVVNVDDTRIPSLVQDGIDGRIGARREVGDHDVLDIVVKEKPGLLPAQRLGVRVEISHRCGTGVAVRHAADERLEPCPLGMGTVERRGTIVNSGTRNKVPIPRRGDVFVFVAS